jgi:hypothetical protein
MARHSYQASLARDLDMIRLLLMVAVRIVITTGRRAGGGGGGGGIPGMVKQLTGQQSRPADFCITDQLISRHGR